LSAEITSVAPIRAMTTACRRSRALNPEDK